MASVDKSVFHQQVCAAFDPVMTAAGLAAGQGGASTVVFCAAFDDLAGRWPLLPQVSERPHPCIDLVVEGDQAELHSVWLEGPSLQATLTAVGLDDAAVEVQRVLGAPLAVALPVVAHALARLFPADD
jgi:hypothetical protein